MQEVFKPDKEDRDLEVLQELIIERGEQVEQNIKTRREPGQKFMKRVMEYTKQDTHWLILGCLSSVLVGVSYPLGSMFIGLEIFTLATKTGSELIEKSSFYAEKINSLGGSIFGLVLGIISSLAVAYGIAGS
jgi:hypothetical protein